MQGDEPTAFVTYDRLEAKILELLSSHVCDADTDDTLLQVGGPLHGMPLLTHWVLFGKVASQVSVPMVITDASTGLPRA